MVILSPQCKTSKTSWIPRFLILHRLAAPTITKSQSWQLERISGKRQLLTWRVKMAYLVSSCRTQNHQREKCWDRSSSKASMTRFSQKYRLCTVTQRSMRSTQRKLRTLSSVQRRKVSKQCWTMTGWPTSINKPCCLLCSWPHQSPKKTDLWIFSTLALVLESWQCSLRLSLEIS